MHHLYPFLPPPPASFHLLLPAPRPLRLTFTPPSPSPPLSWVKRDSYLPVGSQGLKAVTRAKLR